MTSSPIGTSVKLPLKHRVPWHLAAGPCSVSATAKVLLPMLRQHRGTQKILSSGPAKKILIACKAGSPSAWTTPLPQMKAVTAGFVALAFGGGGTRSRGCLCALLHGEKHAAGLHHGWNLPDSSLCAERVQVQRPIDTWKRPLPHCFGDPEPGPHAMGWA